MFESTIECIRNCLSITKGSHILYRDFGIVAVDDPNMSISKQIVENLSKYYPNVSLSDVQHDLKDVKGNNVFNIGVIL